MSHLIRDQMPACVEEGRLLGRTRHPGPAADHEVVTEGEPEVQVKRDKWRHAR